MPGINATKILFAISRATGQSALEPRRTEEVSPSCGSGTVRRATRIGVFAVKEEDVRRICNGIRSAFDHFRTPGGFPRKSSSPIQLLMVVPMLAGHYRIVFACSAARCAVRHAELLPHALSDLIPPVSRVPFSCDDLECASASHRSPLSCS
jgi:hypothetical protein